LASLPLPLRPSALGRLADLTRDARHLQIVVLGALLGYGLVALDFEVEAAPSALVVVTALATQLAFCRARGVPFDARSPLISALSLCLLLRAGHPGLLCTGAAIAVASKFVIRANDKHVFNPTNLAIVVLLATTDSVWVSPGQWGSTVIAGSAFVLAGALVLRRAERADVTWAFLAAWATLLFARSAWLGEPAAIPLHRLQNGGLLLFAFFMLSDPRTTPDSRAGRVAFACVVAAVAFAVRFTLYEPNALLVALALCAPAVPLVDRWLPGHRFVWGARPTAGAHAPVSRISIPARSPS
jgi:Na+-transporting NADH:ubiquinone oxidoreductase subunit NqrB